MTRPDLLIRQLRPGDESLLRRLSEDDARFAVEREPVRAIGPLDDEDATAFLRRHDIFLFAALDGAEPVGFVLGYQLPRRHGATAMLYIHELGVRADRRREGIGRALMDALWTVARTYDTERAFLCTNASNGPAMAFFASFGAVRTAPDEVVLSWRIPRAVVPPDHRHPTLEQGPVRLRPATPDDTELLVGWFADPEVYRWWDGRPATREEVVRDYIGALCPEVEVFIVESDGAPVGLLQYYLLGPLEGGLDMFLIPTARHRGLGPAAARLLTGHLHRELGWIRVIVDPAEGNARGIRGWQNAGFVIERPWPDHPDGPSVLMHHEDDPVTA